MAGSRRVLDGDQVAVRPKTAEARIERARRELQIKMARTQEPLQRLPHAHDYVRVMANLALRADPVLTDNRIAELVRRLLDAGQDLQQIALRGRSRR
jgi:hypothetical protein